MSLRFLNHLFYRMPVRVPDGEFRVLVYLCDKADGAGEDIYPAYERIAGWTGFQEEFIRLSVRRFKSKGWVSGYSQNGFPRWRLRLPGLVVAAPVEKPTGPADDRLLWDRVIVPDDHTIVKTDPVILRGSPEPATTHGLPAATKASPSFVPSFVPSVSPEEHGPPLTRRPSSSLANDPESLDAIRASLANLKMRLEAEAAPASAHRRRRRNR